MADTPNLPNLPNFIYLYTSDRPTPTAPSVWDAYVKNPRPTNRFVRTADTDGMIHLWKTLVRMNIIDKLHIVVDAKQGLGTENLDNNSSVLFHVVPSIELVKSIIKPGDILCVRGGFKAWIPTIESIRQKRENRILFYGANTGHERWPFWDIVLDDLTQKYRVVREGKVFYPFHKPVNEAIFMPTRSELKYDICIGASHIHQKKGQYKVLEALESLYLQTGIKYKLVMPGSFIRCGSNRIIEDILKRGHITCARPGHMERTELCNLFNSCKMFVHGGTGGQNDRSVLEAMACGLPCAITNSSRFSPFVSDNRYNIVSEKDPLSLSSAIQELLHCDHKKWEVVVDYKKNNGLFSKCVPNMRELLKGIRIQGIATS